MKMRSKKICKPSYNFALLMILLMLIVVIYLINNHFLDYTYISNVVIKNIIEMGLMALAVTLIVVTGGIDLSVGSIMILSAMAGGMVVVKVGGILGVLVAIIIGALCGLVNGLVIVKLKLSALVTTLSTMFLFRGIAKGMSAGESVYSYPITDFIGNTEIFGLQLSMLVYIVAAIILTLLLSKTITGRTLYAIGLNENAAKFSGLKVEKVLVSMYVLSGFICALAGFMYLGRFTSIKFDVANKMNLQVVTIIVLGGTSITGGIGDMRGTIIATFIIAVLNSGLTVMNIPIDVQTIINGAVLAISLIVYAILNKHRFHAKEN